MHWGFSASGIVEAAVVEALPPRSSTIPDWPTVKPQVELRFTGPGEKGYMHSAMSADEAEALARQLVQAAKDARELGPEE